MNADRFAVSAEISLAIAQLEVMGNPCACGVRQLLRLLPTQGSQENTRPIPPVFVGHVYLGTALRIYSRQHMHFASHRMTVNICLRYQIVNHNVAIRARCNEESVVRI